MDLSFIIPCYNEEGSLPEFIRATSACLDPTGIAYEFVFIDDGSSDGTLGVLRNASANPPAPMTIVSFSRNFGKEAGIYAGLEHAKGDCLCVIDADMQQDPKLALEMYRKLQEDDEYDCVAACQTNRKENAFIRGCKRTFYHMFTKVGNLQAYENASDFRVFRRNVADALLSMPEYFRFSKGLFAWVGFKTYPYPYTPNERFAGKSKWTFWALVRYALDGLVSFSTTPLKIATYMGLFSSLAALVYIIAVIIERYTRGIDVAGYPTIVSLILIFGGLQLFVLGIIGEYLARDYIEGKKRPIYIAREVISTSDDKD